MDAIPDTSWVAHFVHWLAWERLSIKTGDAVDQLKSRAQSLDNKVPMTKDCQFVNYLLQLGLAKKGHGDVMNLVEGGVR
jgi:hypothetical protein